MTVRVGVNGFGRIGRNFFRAAAAQGADVVARVGLEGEELVGAGGAAALALGQLDDHRLQGALGAAVDGDHLPRAGRGADAAAQRR